MTHTTHARVAGWMFLIYIAAGIGSLIVFNQAIAGGATDAEKLALIVKNETMLRVNVLLTFVQFVNAIVLGVTLYVLTRAEEEGLALLGMSFRIAEGIFGGISIVRTLSILTLASGPVSAESASFVAQLLKLGGTTFILASTSFAIASTIFSYLFLRARTIPRPLAWLGVFASVLLLIVLPLRLLNVLPASAAMYPWAPMLIFEVWLALHFIIKGIKPQAPTDVPG
jgi:hypothetical protein